MRLVLFLGAGFSRSAGFPLMREFSMFSQDLSGYEEQILCLHKCIEYAQRTRAYIHGDIYNVEYLMSVLGLAAITNPNLQFVVRTKTIEVSKALEVLKELVWRVYSRMDNIPLWENTYSKFVRTLKVFLQEQNSSIDTITTNYDLLPEMIMHKIDKPARMPVEFERIPLSENLSLGHDLARAGGQDYSMYSKANAKNIHKLHGSVNWMVNRGQDSVKVHCWDQILSPVNDNRFFHVPFCVLQQAIIPNGYAPLIVPPSLIKEYKIRVIQQAWEDASHAIAKADKIIFIGYSFPPTDTIMKFFLGTSLANNQSGCRITVIDKNAGAVIQSLKEIFVDDICNHHIDLMNVEFEKLFEGYFQSWTDFLDYIKR